MNSHDVVNDAVSKKGSPQQVMVGGKAMNIEELRINKQLLKEISKRKKMKKHGSIADNID